MSLLVPSIVETTSRGERSFDLYSGLLANRIVFLGHPIGPDVANLICAQLLHLADEPHRPNEHHDDAVLVRVHRRSADHAERPIQLYVNSPGGDIDAALAIFDTMQHIQPPISTVCMGTAGSVAALLVAGGEAGQRLALPNARFLLHQPGAERQGQISDLLLAADVVERQRRTVEAIVAELVGSTPEQVRIDTDRDLTLTAPEATHYGLIDAVLEPVAESAAVATLRPD